MPDYLQHGYTPARVPDAGLSLTPPLSLAWSVKANSVVAVSGDRVIARRSLQRGERLVCFDAGGRERWKLAVGLPMGAVNGDTLVMSDSSENAERLATVDLGSGRVIHDHRETDLFVAAFAESGMLLTQSRDTAGLAMRDIAPRFPVRWRWRAKSNDAEHAPSIHLACSTEACFFPFVIGQEGRLIAVSLADGSELWSIGITGMGDFDPHRSTWATTVKSGMVFIDTEKGTAAFDARNGKLRWFADVEGGRTIYGAVLYKCGVDWKAPGGPTRITAIDLPTGRIRWQRSYPEVVKRARGNRLKHNFAISDTHIFAGDDIGVVWALDRASGEPVWHHRPPGPRYFVPWHQPVIAGERLYIATGFEKSVLYCYEPAARKTTTTTRKRPTR